MVLIDQDDP